ncbi:MAG: DJ-1/PfpI family protein [Candidatus Paceibacteria bacterium]
MDTVVLVIAGTGYHPKEYKQTKHALEEEDINVLTASDITPTAIAEDDTRTSVDMSLSEVDMTKYDGVFFLGGVGAEKYLNNSLCYNLAVSAKKENKLYGSMQVSTRILARAGVLEGEQATGWDEDGRLGDILEQNNAKYIEEDPVAVSGDVITAVDSDSALPFARAITERLKEKREVQ